MQYVEKWEKKNKWVG